MKGVVRAERLENPEDFVDAIIERVRREHIAAQYNLPKDGDETWSSSLDLMEMIARKAGRLLKGGDPCIRSAAISLINDFQRGRLPHFVAPPELKDNAADSVDRADPAIVIEQNLDLIGEEAAARPEDAILNEEAEEQEEYSVSDEQVEPRPTSLIADGEWDD